MDKFIKNKKYYCKPLKYFLLFCPVCELLQEINEQEEYQEKVYMRFPDESINVIDKKSLIK